MKKAIITLVLVLCMSTIAFPQQFTYTATQGPSFGVTTYVKSSGQAGMKDIDIGWGYVGPAITHFQIYSMTVGGADTVTVLAGNIPPGTTLLTIATVPADGITRWYGIRAVNGFGASGFAPVPAYVPDERMPALPINVYTNVR